MLAPLKMIKNIIKYLEKKRNIPQVMSNMNYTCEDKDNTLIRLSIWIRRNTVSNSQNQYIGSENQMRK